MLCAVVVNATQPDKRDKQESTSIADEDDVSGRAVSTACICSFSRSSHRKFQLYCIGVETASALPESRPSARRILRIENFFTEMGLSSCRRRMLNADVDRFSATMHIGHFLLVQQS
jgi:hypothetical protein